ncbi:MAG: iron-sulfur cluster biosynthesis transcriptional regulator SufR [Cyanobacteriota bacterium]|nr:iron-sulfur cluster biosynthesis transcriptional regulator SufR [Cyanobacteriota bacterium]
MGGDGAPEPHGPATDSALPNGEATPTRQALLTQLLHQGEATASDLARKLALSVQVMRRHLRSLEEEGLVEASPTPEGPGRPSNRWRLTPSGHGRFTDGSEQFALGLLQSLAETLPAEELRSLLEQQALQKASDYRRRLGDGGLRQRLERLAELRRQEGYVAECRPDPDDPDAWLISEFHCSVMRIAEAFPIVCDQELQLIRHTFPDCRIERVHWRLEEGHSCGFRLSPAAAHPRS